jgi:hypothetical protein
MYPTYEACQKVRGKPINPLSYSLSNLHVGNGSHARHTRLVRETLTGPAVFREIHRLICTSQDNAIYTFFQQLMHELNKEFELLETDIQSVVCEEGQVSESQRYPKTAAAVLDLAKKLAMDLKSHGNLIRQLQR